MAREEKSMIVRHSLNEKIVRVMLSIGSTTREIADHYNTSLNDVRKYINEVIRQKK